MMSDKLFLPLFFIFSFATGLSQEMDLENYPVKPIDVPNLTRPSIEIQQTKIPQIFTGVFPTFDGEFFHLNITEKKISESNIDNAQMVLESFLPSLNWRQPKDVFRSISPLERPMVKKESVDKIIKDSHEETMKNLMRRYPNINEETARALVEQQNLAQKQSEQKLIIYQFDQYFDDIPIDNTFIRVLWITGEGFKSLNGRLFNDIKLGNTLLLSDKQAIEAATDYIKKYDEVISEGTEYADKVILPYEATFYYTWRTEINTVNGSYAVWVDAQSGKILKLVPLYSSVEGRGLRFDLNPNGGTTEVTFEINAASGGVYRLQLNGFLEVNNNGADGVCSGDLTIADDGSGSANFNVSPINGTVVDRTNQTGYNCRFQDVNAYAWIYNHLTTFNDILGSVTMPAITVTVNHNNPCNFGINNACANWGTWDLRFGIGQATVSSSNSCNDLFNSALDATILTHEFGHLVNARNNSGTFPLHMHEGLADFWGYTMNNTDIVGAYWGQNCANTSQAGWLPRQVEGLDVFPEHRTLSTSAYGDGQIIGWALWNVRREFNEMSALGTYLINSNLLDALATVAFGDLATAKQRHDNFLALEQELADLFKTSTNVHKVLSGFACAGIFLAPSDAVIDINDDYLSRGSVAGPTFTIWTGRDYTFNANGTVNTGTQPFNTRYEIEVANDVGFTDNLRTSGVLGGVVSADGGTATWTLPPADWNILKVKNRLYYRVRTTNDTGGNIRNSTDPGNSFFTGVPVAYAVINNSGDCECTCGTSASTKSGAAAITLVPVLFGILWIVKLKRQKK